MSRIRRALGALGVGVGAAVLALVGWLGWTFGEGAPYPDRSGPPRLGDAALELVVSHPEPIGNLAVAADGRVFFTVHPESRPRGALLWVADEGLTRPWPDEAAQAKFVTPLGARIDGQGRLWVIDHGQHGLMGATLWGFDTTTGAVVAEHRLGSDVAPMGSMLQDLTISADGATAYVADISVVRREPAVIVVNTSSGAARRVLSGHPALSAQPWRVRAPGGDLVLLGGLLTLTLGLDGVALSQDGDWLWLAAMCHDTVFRVPTAALLDEGLSEAALSAQLVAVGKKPLNDGIIADSGGAILIGDVEHQAISRVTEDGAAETLLRSPRLRWVDGMSFGPDGALYIADSALPDVMLRSHAHIDAQAPYFIWRFTPPAGDYTPPSPG
jgi:sugar lactone lactonase YvrE